VLAKDYNQHSNRPDGDVLYLKDGLLSLPILMSNFKKEDKDYGNAVNESIGYFQVMPCTLNQLSLFLCWPMH